jgi:hypothetical protein
MGIIGGGNVGRASKALSDRPVLHTAAPTHDGVPAKGGAVQERSYEPLTKSDLKRLQQIAARDRELLFRRKPELGRLYAGRLFALALCQGAALHYLDRKNGVKDLDVWSFYRAAPRPYPYRRRAIADFGDPKFGKSPNNPQFVGRNVDLLGRSIDADDFSDPVSVLRGYLGSARTKSARLLALKAVVLIEPRNLLGVVVWPARRADYSPSK